MAKKKGKKAQKVEWTSPPPSPKAAPEDPVPAIPTSLALERDTKEPTLTESSRDVSEQSLVAPKETGITDISVEQPVQETTPAEDIPAEEPFAPPFPPQTQRKGPALGEEERIESAPKAVQEERTPDDRGQVLEPVPVPEPEQTDEFPTKEEQRTVTADSTPIESNQPITQETELPAPRSILIDEPPLEEQREPIEEEIFEAVVPTEQVQTTFEEPLTKPGPEVEASTEAEPSLLRKKSKKKGEKTTSSWDEPSEDPTKEVSETNSEPTPIAVQIPNSVPSLEETAKEIKNPDLAPEEIVQEVSRPKETAKEIEKPERAPEEIIQEVSRPKETIVDVKDAETNPVHVHFEAPIEAAPVEAPLEAPLEIPVQTHIEVPVKAPIEVPVELAPLEAPVQGPVEVLVKSPAPAPVEPLVQAPVEAPVEAPVDFQALLAAPIPAQTPGPIAAPIPSPIPAYIATLVAAAGGTPSPPSAESISPIPSPVYPEALTRSPPSEAIDQERRPTFNYPQSPPRAVASEREGPPTYTYPQSSLRSGASEREGPPTTSTYPQTHPRSVATERERPSAFTSPESPRSVATDRERSPISSTYPQPPLRSVAAERERAPNPFAYPQPLPKPAAVNHILEDSRLPSAPSPPVTRARPRHTAFHNSALETEDEDDTALTYPRFRGHAPYRDPSRDKTYPPPPQPQPRSVFASRVPVEHYPSQQAPPQPPPSYHHPQYYPPQAPPYYQGPGHMSQPGGYPNHAPYGPQSHDSHTSHSSSPYRETWNHPYGPYGSQSPPHRHEHLGSREYGRLPAIQNGEDDTDVFARISQAIPDLHVLLAKYKETHGQLGVREELLRRADAEQEEKLRIKDQEVHSLQERIAHLESRQSTEAGRLRLEIGNMEEQLKDLKEQLAETARYKQEAGKLRATLDTATKYWESRHKDLDEAHSTLQKISSEATARARKEFEDWRYTATTKHDAEKIALAIQFDKQLREADVRVVKEKNELRAECEQALQREREDMEVWEKERSALVQAHREDIEGLRKSWEEQRLLLEEQADERKRQLDQLLQDKEDVQKQYNQLRSESGKERDVIKSVVGNLESEKARLEKLMESYGDIAEIKSKGDTYYLVSFAQLQNQIMDLAATHFVHLPVSPPPDDLTQVPSSLPSFLGDTAASRQLRAMYVVHTVSKLITYRVFGPFLFSLGRRYDKADSLFSSMSTHIRDKSTRKEAIWRQQTLIAAFTSSGAKQRINTAASTVVEEIVNAIKNFTSPKEEEGIKIAVKRIVKLAAETWRFARLEREMIAATMPALQDEEHQFTGPEFWQAVKSESTHIPSLDDASSPSDERPKLLLRLFPVIYREAQHENFRESDDEKPDDGCIYHHGLALYDDADTVVRRAEELRAAGLPPMTTAPPTAADFPPPLLPAPRDPVPPTPEVENFSTRPRSPTPSKRARSDRASSLARSPITKAADRSSRWSSIPPFSVLTEMNDAISALEQTISLSCSPVGEEERSHRPSATSPLPASTEFPEAVSIPNRLHSKRQPAVYTRPPPGPVKYNYPSELSSAPLTESNLTARNDKTSEDFDIPHLPTATESIAPSMNGLLVHELLNGSRDAPSTITYTESTIIPPFSPESTKNGGSGSNLATPLHANIPHLPVSSFFDAIDAIETPVSSQQSRNPYRRHLRAAEEEVSKDRERHESVRRSSRPAEECAANDRERPESTRRFSRPPEEEPRKDRDRRLSRPAEDDLFKDRDHRLSRRAEGELSNDREGNETARRLSRPSEDEPRKDRDRRFSRPAEDQLRLSRRAEEALSKDRERHDSHETIRRISRTAEEELSKDRDRRLSRHPTEEEVSRNRDHRLSSRPVEEESSHNRDRRLSRHADKEPAKDRRPSGTAEEELSKERDRRLSRHATEGDAEVSKDPRDRRLSRPSEDESPKDRERHEEATLRRTSGHSLSTRSSDQGSLRTEKTDRTERTERSSNSRYLCESRSAAIKGLYPGSPLAGMSPNLSRTNSFRSQKKSTKVEGAKAEGTAVASDTTQGTWDTGTPSAAEPNPELLVGAVKE